MPIRIFISVNMNSRNIMRSVDILNDSATTKNIVFKE